jgi:lysophospholipase L1-like esterase
LRLALGWGILCLVALVSLELTARIEDLVRFGMPLLAPYRSQVDLIVRDRAGMHGRPLARYQKWSMNSLGTRGPEVALAKPSGTVRVVTAGASETFGLYESPDHEFPRQLEARLNDLGARCGVSRRFEVLNAALPGMSLPTVTQDLRLRLAGYGTDIVVLYPTPVQYLSDDVPTAAPPDTSGVSSAPPWTWALYPRSAERIRNQIKSLTPTALLTRLRERFVSGERRSRGGGWLFQTVPADRLQAYETDLRRFVATARTLGIQPVLATHANALGARPDHGDVLLTAWERFYPRATGPVLVAFDSAAAAVTLQVGRDAGVVASDLHGRLASPGRERLFEDYAHFTDAGAAVVAATLAPDILRLTGLTETACLAPGGSN